MRAASRAAAGGERGATMVEAAITVPVLLLLIFAILEFGLAFRDYLTVANVTRFTARTAAAVGNDPSADYRSLRKVIQSSAAMDYEDIDYVVVFEAANPQDTMANATTGPLVTCRGGTAVTGTCNVYRPADFALHEDDFGCASDQPDRFWCPSDRKTALTGPNGPPDYIGVYVKVTHDYVTGLFGQTITLTDETIMRVEPKANE